MTQSDYLAEELKSFNEVFSLRSKEANYSGELLYHYDVMHLVYKTLLSGVKYNHCE